MRALHRHSLGTVTRQQRWARWEFERIAERETRAGYSLIIPIRCGMTTAQGDELSPILPTVDRLSGTRTPGRSAGSPPSLAHVVRGRPRARAECPRGRSGAGAAAFDLHAARSGAAPLSRLSFLQAGPHHSRLRRGAGAAEHLGFTAARVTYVWLAVLVPGALVAWGIIDARRRP